jgi:hypothetical protein
MPRRFILYLKFVGLCYKVMPRDDFIPQKKLKLESVSSRELWECPAGRERSLQ